MDSVPFQIRPTWYGGRGVFATQSIPKGTLLHACSAPYASVIYRVFRKEVCGQCFAYAFDARRNAWNVKLEAGGGIWFCGDACKDTWIRDENVNGLVGVINAAVDKLARQMEKRPSPPLVPEVLVENPSLITLEAIDSAWVAAETTSLPSDTHPGSSPCLTEMELDTVRFILSAVVRRYIDDTAQSAPLLNSWSDLLQLQDNELQHVRGRPAVLESHLRIFSFVRRVAVVLPALAPYLSSCETVRAIVARDQGNVFGMYDMSTAGDSEMLGWSMYVSAACFNHDCAPNVRKERAGRSLQFYTTRDIGVDEELCISYIDVDDAVKKRRQELSENWYFDCVCQRCDREMGTT
ncbi:hypothetical protein C8J57DRAFT_1181871 [Mycena rebaudengoi]|nr:hypothetical protein C8J57DRAFT_1181871 [Mycena rebaudengoi]